MTRAFLLTNLDAVSEHEPLRFKVPLDIMENSLDEIGSFPYNPGERTWSKPTLFIKGSRSRYYQFNMILSPPISIYIVCLHLFRYINHRNISIAKDFFPNMQLETLEAGHWGTLNVIMTILFH